MFKNITILTAILLALACLSSTVQAGKTSIDISANDLTTYDPTESTLGDYYVIQFDVPKEIKNKPVQFTFLEFFVDASTEAKDGYTNKTPVIETYALKSAFLGTVDPSQFEAQTVPTAINVVVGEGRRVLVDISEIVRSYQQNPTKNHGLIVGSLTGTREGLFSLREDQLGGSAVGKITFFY